MQDDVTKAKATLVDLRTKREAVVHSRDRLKARQNELSFAGSTGDAAAAAELKKIIAEIRDIDPNIETLDAAIEEAERRVTAAEEAVRTAADREKAKKIRALAADVPDLAKKIEDSLAAAADAIRTYHARVVQIAAMGALTNNVPRLQQIAVGRRIAAHLKGVDAGVNDLRLLTPANQVPMITQVVGSIVHSAERHAALLAGDAPAKIAVEAA